MKPRYHTPGPWNIRWVNNQDYMHAVIVTGMNAKRKGGFSVLHSDMDNWQANAKLCSAAPNLLEALKDVSNAYQEMFDAMPVAWQTIDDIVQAAIAKAEGK